MLIEPDFRPQHHARVARELELVDGVALREYLDDAIESWRRQAREQRTTHVTRDLTRAEGVIAEHYVDAFQSVRKSVFGEPKP